MSVDSTRPSATSVATFLPSSSSRTSPFPPSSAATNNAMTASAFLSQSQVFRPNMSSQAPYSMPISALASYDRDMNRAVGAPLSATPSTASTVLIRRLPLNTSEETLRLMMVFSKDLSDVEVLSPDNSDDPGFRSALLRFETPAGAQEAKNMLDGKSNISNDAKMIVEIIGSGASPISSRRYLGDSGGSGSGMSTGSAARQTPRFTGFGGFDKLSSPFTSPSNNTSDSNGADTNAGFPNFLSPKSPMGGQPAERQRVSGKSLINNDSADDDETGELLRDPLAYAENGAGPTMRRQTAPQLPIRGMASLSLNTSNAMGPSSMPPYPHHGLNQLPPPSAAMSPTNMNGQGPPMNFPMNNSHFRQPNFPPVNPADQNPPCNTLYVGNLPIDTSEEELKAMFSKQRGYKRLCFRTKQNGPMCFVEFEDVSFATKALHELYGHMLHNSVKGGIRLSFSKNPLGVRSAQGPGPNNGGPMGGGMNGMMSAVGNGFAAANGPPPGLTMPPGLGNNRGPYGGGASNGGGGPGSTHSYPNSGYHSPAPSSSQWGGSTAYNTPITTSGQGNGYPSYMMGK